MKRLTQYANNQIEKKENVIAGISDDHDSIFIFRLKMCLVFYVFKIYI